MPRLILPLLLALTLLLWLLLPIALQPPLADAPIRETTHAEYHAEAQQIRDCLKSGVTQLWRSRSWRTPDKFFRVCLLPDGKWGMQIVRYSVTSGTWYEVTAFIVKKSQGGTYVQLREYLSGIARQVTIP